MQNSTTETNKPPKVAHLNKFKATSKTQTGTTKTMQSKSEPSSRQRLVAAHLWKHLTHELGSAFKNQFGVAGGVEFEYWLEQLTSYSENEIAGGLQLFKNSSEKFISLKIFRSFCDEARRQAKKGREYPALPKLHNAAAQGDEKCLKVGNDHLKKLLGARKK